MCFSFESRLIFLAIRKLCAPTARPNILTEFSLGETEIGQKQRRLTIAQASEFSLAVSKI